MLCSWWLFFTPLAAKPNYELKYFDCCIMKPLVTFILLTICLTTVAQTTPERNWVDTEVKYTDAAGNVIMVQNSLPKGGGGYIDVAGKKYSYVILWTRIVNESATPLKFMMKFPADTFAIFPSPDSYIRLFLPPDIMAPDKIQLVDYGLTNLKPFLDAEFNRPSLQRKILKPNEEYYFYIPILLHQARGTARTALVLKEHDLFYKVNIGEHSTLIPCGRIYFEN